MDPKRNTARHIIIKLPKIKHKERILKEARGKERVTYKGVLIRLSAHLSKETLQARRSWEEVFQVMKYLEYKKAKTYIPKMTLSSKAII